MDLERANLALAREKRKAPQTPDADAEDGCDCGKRFKKVEENHARLERKMDKNHEELSTKMDTLIAGNFFSYDFIFAWKFTQVFSFISLQIISCSCTASGRHLFSKA